jgi:chromosome partitioning protein
LFDGSPNWNLLITNALAASDIVISPLECKINNFRNFKMFEAFISEFKQDLDVNFKHIFVPTRYHARRKLSQEIFDWYQDNITDCIATPIAESNIGEEATAMHLSAIEYNNSATFSLIMNKIISEIWEFVLSTAEVKRSLAYQQEKRQTSEQHHGLNT